MGKEFPSNQHNSSFQNLLMPKFVASGKVREAEEGHGKEQEDAGEDCESAAEEVY
ncbi:hypothetical protein PC129_g17451 [Phytophthora cactorum]|uniref:Uncharacterized protein n=1 Tax=Phytophthora cactorum TaxID=29920 RepID=A0A8T1HHW2_9STRA|nr:hypothetical protein Pcac1_g4613 [Phytophthora cactorum]KAG2898706.1 hypothetical protein PC114_g14188 [Phytophthora cactorum]KAG2954444.1 hypothetical protein PC117_g1153 [Phytophthora cactorum]KAG3037899.1 hypothetical protein PC119_g3253 [Phytophthora cactorum]KAG3158864.1 hypothetical protein C6341_g14280 [Phytophthora cactorum]